MSQVLVVVVMDGGDIDCLSLLIKPGGNLVIVQPVNSQCQLSLARNFLSTALF